MQGRIFHLGLQLPITTASFGDTGCSVRPDPPRQRLHREGRVRRLIQAVQGPIEERERCPGRVSRHEELEVAVQATFTPFKSKWLRKSKVRDFPPPIIASLCIETVTGSRQLQKSANDSDAESKSEFCRRAAQSLLTIFERHASFHADEIHGHVGHATGSYEERDENLSDMTGIIKCTLYSAICPHCCLMLRPPPNVMTI